MSKFGILLIKLLHLILTSLKSLNMISTDIFSLNKKFPDFLAKNESSDIIKKGKIKFIDKSAQKLDKLKKEEEKNKLNKNNWSTIA